MFFSKVLPPPTVFYSSISYNLSKFPEKNPVYLRDAVTVRIGMVSSTTCYTVALLAAQMAFDQSELL